MICGSNKTVLFETKNFIVIHKTNHMLIQYHTTIPPKPHLTPTLAPPHPHHDATTRPPPEEEPAQRDSGGDMGAGREALPGHQRGDVKEGAPEAHPHPPAEQEEASGQEGRHGVHIADYRDARPDRALVEERAHVDVDVPPLSSGAARTLHRD